MKLEINLNDLYFYSYIGVFPQEKTVGNEFNVDLSVIIDVSEDIIKNDDISTIISYADLYEIIREEMQQKYDLLETAALNIRNKILEKWSNIEGGYIKITKLKPPIKSFIGKASIKLNFF